MTAPNASTEYTCPGEVYPITRAVHLSRLAAFYPKCRECPHRHDTGQLAQTTLERLQSTERRVERRSLFVSCGIRGVYLNELNRHHAAEYAGALASLLWDRTPLLGSSAMGLSERGRRRRRGPVVVVGHDDRPSSPDLFLGIIPALRRMGCGVLDVGQLSRPCFCFAVDHLQAAAGIYVTGAGHGPAWTGLDVFGARGQPWCQPGTLDELERCLTAGFHRTTRFAGAYRTFQARTAYEAGLLKHFQSLRPVRLVVGCVSQSVRHTLQRLSQGLPCHIQIVDAASMTSPESFRQAVFPKDPVTHRPEMECDGGMLIHEDGQSCTLFDRQGMPIESEMTSEAVVRFLFDDFSDAKLACSSERLEHLQPRFQDCRATCVDGGENVEIFWQTMRGEEVECGIDAHGRLWFQDGSPRCDALLTLAHVLQALSRGDNPLAERLRGLRPTTTVNPTSK